MYFLFIQLEEGPPTLSHDGKDHYNFNYEIDYSKSSFIDMAL